jgi:four helix bundle protein
MLIKSFKNLVVWQKSFDLTKQIYLITEKLPQNEQFGLSSQMRRSAVSIPSNIAEGQQRNNIKEYRQFLGVAKGSAAELETQLLLVQNLFNIDTKESMELLSEVQRMLWTLIKKL